MKETCTFVVVSVVIITVIIAIIVVNVFWSQNYHNVFILQWVKRGSDALIPSSLSHDLVSFAYTALTSF